MFVTDIFLRIRVDSGEPTYTLSEAVEKLGFGRFQMNIIWMVGFFVVSTIYLYILEDSS